MWLFMCAPPSSWGLFPAFRCLFSRRFSTVQAVLVALFDYELCFPLVVADIAAANADYASARLESGREITRGKVHSRGWASVGCHREVLWLFTCAS